MAFFQRLLALAFIPVIAFVSLQTWLPRLGDHVQDALQPYFSDTLLSPLFPEPPLLRSETPLVITAFPHWSHYEKIAKIAVVLADLGYPITFITGRIFETETRSLHPNITFYAIHGKADKMTAEDYEKLKSFKPGSPEEQLFLMQKSLIESMPDQHETLQHVFRDFSNRYGDTKPLISMFDVPYLAHHPILLGAPSVKKPDSSIGLNCHPIMLNSIDTFPSHLGIPPHRGPDAHAIHREANKLEHMSFTTREISRAYWEKVQELGATADYGWQVYHAIQAVPDHLMTLGVPEFNFPRSDFRPNVHFFGALPTAKRTSPVVTAELPEWWDDIAQAKQEGKKLVAVSQGTVGLNLNDLLIPTLEALENRSDVLVIATTVAVEVADVPGLMLPANARAAKFVPYDQLLPEIDVLVNNGGYGAVIQSLALGIPMVLAGQGQDKNVTNTILEWKELGINLGRMDPSVNAIRDGVAKVLDDAKYKDNAVEMSRNFRRYDVQKVFDGVIQSEVRKWRRKAWKLGKKLGEGGGGFVET